MNLELFTCEGNSKFTLSKVFVKGGYRCTTNGRMAIRIKCDEPDTEGNFPKLDDAFNEPFSEINPIKIVTPELEVYHICPECDNGRIYYNFQECTECYGLGTCRCGCPTEHACGTCGGDGGNYTKSKPCQFCDGTKKRYTKLQIGEWYYQGHYIKLACQELPNLTAIGLGKNGMLRLTFDGGECAIMPFTSTK